MNWALGNIDWTLYMLSNFLIFGIVMDSQKVICKLMAINVISALRDLTVDCVSQKHESLHEILHP